MRWSQAILVAFIFDHIVLFIYCKIYIKELLMQCSKMRGHPIIIKPYWMIYMALLGREIVFLSKINVSSRYWIYITPVSFSSKQYGPIILILIVSAYILGFLDADYNILSVWVFVACFETVNDHTGQQSNQTWVYYK